MTGRHWHELPDALRDWPFVADVVDRIDELAGSDRDDLDDDELDELSYLTAFEAANPGLREMADDDGTMVPDDDFVEYARELARDIGAVSDDAAWPGRQHRLEVRRRRAQGRSHGRRVRRQDLVAGVTAVTARHTVGDLVDAVAALDAEQGSPLADRWGSDGLATIVADLHTDHDGVLRARRRTEPTHPASPMVRARMRTRLGLTGGHPVAAGTNLVELLAADAMARMILIAGDHGCEHVNCEHRAGSVRPGTNFCPPVTGGAVRRRVAANRPRPTEEPLATDGGPAYSGPMPNRTEKGTRHDR